MALSLVQQVARQTQIESLLRALGDWGRPVAANRVVADQSKLIQTVLERSPELLQRLEAPLVVATFGGTGVGKSSLTNALVGAEVAVAGRQRPTTTTPALIAHDETVLTALGFPETSNAAVTVVRSPQALLRQCVLLDCPDPDTDETADPGTNLARLRELLPRCDVLIVVSTQERYLEARVNDELADAAQRCRLVFVQTRADVDTDIRDDWRARLQSRYDVHDIFFIDCREALLRQQQDLPATGEFARLLELLERESIDGTRSRVRQANVVDLAQLVIAESLGQLAAAGPSVQKLQHEIERYNERLILRLSERIGQELSGGQSLWERRLIEQIAERWGASPFSLLLRVRSRWAALIGSWALMRSRNVVQAVLVGGVQAAHWVRQNLADESADGAVERVPGSVVTDADLLEATTVIAGFAYDAGIEFTAGNIEQCRAAASTTNARILDQTRSLVDELIREQTSENAGAFLRFRFEASFILFPAFLLGLIIKNFFYDALWNNQPFLDLSFYLPAVVLLALWCGLFLWLFQRRLQRGLRRRIGAISQALAVGQQQGNLFSEVRLSANRFFRQQSELQRLATQCEELRAELDVVVSRLAKRH